MKLNQCYKTHSWAIRTFDYFDRFIFDNDGENKELKEKLLSNGMHIARMHAEKNHTNSRMRLSMDDDAAYYFN